MTEKPKFKLPHTLVLIYVLVLLAYVLTLALPSGRFEMRKAVIGGTERSLPVAGTFHAAPKPAVGPEILLLAPVKGFEDGIEIIAFLFVIGGAFAVILKTGALEAGIQRLSALFARRPSLRRLVIPVLMTVFSGAGAVFGMCEETIPFVLIFIPLALSLGYDSIVGVAIPFLGAAAGFAAAFLNPFTVGMAQSVSKIPLYSGMEYRLVLWVLGTAVVVAYVMVYAERVRRRPELSPVRDIDQARDLHGLDRAEPLPWGFVQKLVVLLLAAAMGALVWGILAKQWGIPEMAGLFLALGLAAGFAGRLTPSEVAALMVSGAKDMVGVAFVIACGRAFLMILQAGVVEHTVLEAMASAISLVPSFLRAQVMFLAQAVINFFIHSGTTQAVLTMPLMSPLGNLVGIPSQVSVLAFQLCEFVNPVLPTSAVTMGILGMAGIPYERWAKWFFPLLLILAAFSLLALVPPTLFFHYGP